jgi:hypothetical protein
MNIISIEFISSESYFSFPVKIITASTFPLIIYSWLFAKNCFHIYWFSPYPWISISANTLTFLCKNDKTVLMRYAINFKISLLLFCILNIIDEFVLAKSFFT